MTKQASVSAKPSEELSDKELNRVVGGDSARMSIKVSPEYTRQHLTGSGHLP
jgi:bacteriocin-like protein